MSAVNLLLADCFPLSGSCIVIDAASENPFELLSAIAKLGYSDN